MKNVYVYQKIFNVSRKIGRVFKNAKNEIYKYVSATNVVDAIKPLLIEEKLIIIPAVFESLKDGEFARVKIEYTIVDVETGEELKKTWEGEGMHKRDKAYTGCYKYFLMNLFVIPTSGNPLSDSETYKRSYEYKKILGNAGTFQSS